MRTKNQWKYLFMAVFMGITVILPLTGCGSSESNLTSANTESAADHGSGSSESKAEAPEIAGLTWESAMDLVYAEHFQVYYYNDGYKVIEVKNSRNYLVVPEGKEIPEGIDENLTVLQQPLDHVYLAATSAMSLINAIGETDSVILTGTDTSGWHIQAPIDALASGSMQYAGKYSEPDYELMLAKDCNLAIESTMILHSPEVQEMIEDIGIPVFIDYASYEEQPLGRTEWIKLYGALFNQEEQAETFFEEQAQVIDDQENFEQTDLTVAYFTVSSDGSISIRKESDYISKMIELGGAKNIFAGMKEPSGSSTSVSLSMEEFYSQASKADYLIYNATIEDSLKSLDDLKKKDELFADFKAVKEGHVWQVDKKMYQSTDTVGQFISDVHHMITDEDESGMTFLMKVK